MPTFTYNAINDAGLAVSGEIDADSTDAVSEIISERGLLLTTVKQKTAGKTSFDFSGLMERLTPVKAP